MECTKIDGNVFYIGKNEPNDVGVEIEVLSAKKTILKDLQLHAYAFQVLNTCIMDGSFFFIDNGTGHEVNVLDGDIAIPADIIMMEAEIIAHEVMPKYRFLFNYEMKCVEFIYPTEIL